MTEPLSKSQQELRGRKLSEMSDEQLEDWIDACLKMEKWIRTASKARRSWKISGVEAQSELDQRRLKLKTLKSGSAQRRPS